MERTPTKQIEMGASAKRVIEEDVMTVLKNSAITGTHLKLPGQLDRKLYERVNKVLTIAGGKWNRSAGVHVFQADPREILGMAVSAGHIVDKKVELQQFFTPPAVAKVAVDRLMKGRTTKGITVMEPSCGSGNMLAALFEYDINPALVNAVEIDEPLAKAVQAKYPTMHVVNGDFLKLTKVASQDLVIMNPPFTNQQDIMHVTRALGHLKPGGRMVAIVSPAYGSSTTKKAEAFRELLDEHAIEEYNLPAGSFAASGTQVHTVMLVINKV